MFTCKFTERTTRSDLHKSKNKLCRLATSLMRNESVGSNGQVSSMLTHSSNYSIIYLFFLLPYWRLRLNLNIYFASSYRIQIQLMALSGAARGRGSNTDCLLQTNQSIKYLVTSRLSFSWVAASFWRPGAVVVGAVPHWRYCFPRRVYPEGMRAWGCRVF